MLFTIEYIARVCFFQASFINMNNNYHINYVIYHNINTVISVDKITKNFIKKKISSVTCVCNCLFYFYFCIFFILFMMGKALLYHARFSPATYITMHIVQRKHLFKNFKLISSKSFRMKKYFVVSGSSHWVKN